LHGEPFPEQLGQSDAIHNRYRQRRTEARKYLTKDKVQLAIAKASRHKLTSDDIKPLIVDLPE
jgi:hypothetical protein